MRPLLDSPTLRSLPVVQPQCTGPSGVDHVKGLVPSIAAWRRQPEAAEFGAAEAVPGIIRQSWMTAPALRDCSC